MSRTVIELENVCKYYRLGTIGGATLSEDINAWWAKIRGKENPLLTIGEKDYGNQEGEYIWALRDINLKVEQGDILGIIGANGAGKSTLLKILSRITGPTSGKVKIKGRIGSLLEVGTGFHPELTGRENVYLNGAILGMRRHEIDKKFDEIVDFSGVEKYIDTPVKRYSSGMRVRLGFAVAAHLDPEILVVDEVLAVGDAEFQNKCIGKMSDVAGEGRTVLFVSHNMGSILKLCKSCIEMKSGEIINQGDTSNVIYDYLNKSKQIEEGELSWVDSPEDAPGNKDYIVYRKLNISSNNNESKHIFLADDELSVSVEYEILQKMEKAWLGITITTPDGELLFCSGDHKYGYEEYMVREPGIYKTTFKIPSLFLNEGKYYLGVLGHIPNVTMLADDDKLLYFEVLRSKFIQEGKIPGKIICNLEYFSNELP